MTQEVTETTTVCYNHPNRETFLRCNRCDRPICTTCAVLTPTGYRCRECMRSQQKIFETAQWYDYPLATLTAAVLAFIGSLIASRLGFFTIFIAPIFGVMIAEAVRWIIKRRRSRLLFRLATAATIVGALIIPLMNLASLLLFGSGGFGLFALLWPAIYVFLAASTVYYRLSGIQIR